MCLPASCVRSRGFVEDVTGAGVSALAPVGFNQCSPQVAPDAATQSGRPFSLWPRASVKFS